MADVFISYSRKDSDFVRRLDAELAQRGRETWVDWEGIQPTEEFMLAIYAAIEAADTFVFILTPDSVASVVCGKEIAHADAHNKRMVPIVARDVDAATVPESLAKLNWIFCREADDFKTASDTLITALDTDLPWIRAHTRLLGRAREWEAKRRENSFVLRGVDLREAEKWLAEAGTDKERQPTALQTEYVIASRKAAARTQRNLLGASAGAAVVAIVLAVFAWTQRSKAMVAADEATRSETNAKRERNAAVERLSQSYFAEGNRLADDGQAARALAYCAAAVRNNAHVPAATRIATLLTDRAWARPLLVQRVENAMRAWFSPDGRFAVALLADGSAEIRETATGNSLSSPIRLNGPIAAARFAPDGTRVVISSEAVGKPEEAKASFQLWECQTGRAIGAPLSAKGKVADVCFSPDSRKVAVCSGDSTFFHDTKSGQLEWKTAGSGSARFSANGSRIVTVSDFEQTAQVWDTRTGAPIGKRITGEDLWMVESAALSPDGTRVATGLTSDSEKGAVRVWEVSSGKALTGWLEQEFDVNEVAFSPDGQWLLAATRAIAQVFDVGAGKAVQPPFRLPTGVEMIAACFSPEGDRVATAGSDGSVCVWDLHTGRIATELWTQRGLDTVAFTIDGRAIVSTSSAQRERQVRRVLAGVARPSPLEGAPQAGQGPLLLTIGDAPASGGKSGVRVWNLETGQKVLEAPVDLGETAVKAAQFSRNEERAAIAFGKIVKIWDLATGKELPELRHRQEVADLEFHATGQKLLTIADTAIVWDALAGKALLELRTAAPVSSARFVPDGTSIVTVSADGTVQIWDAATGALRGASQVPPAEVVSEQLSPDGKRAAIHTRRDAKGWVHLLDVATGQPVVPPIDAGTERNAVVLSPDGARLALATEKTLRMIATSTGAEIFPAVPLSADVQAVSFSADSRLFATEGDAFRIWDAATGQPTLNAIKPIVRSRSQARFTSVAFSPDGRRLVASALIGHHEAEGTCTRLYDPATGAALSDFREMSVQAGDARFTSDGRRLLEGSARTWIWELPPSVPPPPWLPALAEAVAGERLDAQSVVASLESQPQALADIAIILQNQNQDDPWVKLGQWVLAEERKKSIAPGSMMTVSDFIARGLREDDVDELQEILRAAPDEAALHARLGVKWLAKQEEYGAEAKMRADRATLLATLLEPGSANVWKSRAEVLQALKRRAEADQASTKASTLESSAKQGELMK